MQSLGPLVLGACIGHVDFVLFVSILFALGNQRVIPL